VFLSALIFALAVSMDGFGVGFAYGMRKIKIPLFSLLIICLSSAAAITLSMFFGGLVRNLFNPAFGERFGAGVIVLVGLYLIFQALAAPGNKKISDTQPYKVFRLNLSRLGIVIEVLRQPAKADFDRSGTINSWEAMVLGFALAMDALGAGFGAAVAGFRIWLTPVLVAVCKFLLVSAGVNLGKNASSKRLSGRFVSVLPGLILILIGIAKI